MSSPLEHLDSPGALRRARVERASNKRSKASAILAAAALMRITIYAATGVLGRPVLDPAVAQGRDVTAVVRDRKTVPRGVHGSEGVGVVPTHLGAPDRGVEAKGQPSPDRSKALKGRRDRSGALRAGVFGMSDGLVSNTALVMGLAGSGVAHRLILLAGVAGLLAGSLSMAAGEYVSMASQREMYEREISLEALELEENPKEKRHELLLLYLSKGPRARRLGGRRRPDHGRSAGRARHARSRGARP